MHRTSSCMHSIPAFSLPCQFSSYPTPIYATHPLIYYPTTTLLSLSSSPPRLPQAFHARPPASEAQDQYLQHSLRAFPLEADPLAHRDTARRGQGPGQGQGQGWRRKKGGGPVH